MRAKKNKLTVRPSIQSVRDGLNRLESVFTSKGKNSLPLLIAALSLLLSIAGLVYTSRTFSITHRPYLGVIDVHFQLLETPPTVIAWQFVVKNVGDQPATMRIEKNVATLTSQHGATALPLVGSGEDQIHYVMPGQTVELFGQYSEVDKPIKMTDILNGAARLEVFINLTYSGEGAIGRKSYYYSSHFRFETPKGFPSVFSTIKAEGN